MLVEFEEPSKLCNLTRLFLPSRDVKSCVEVPVEGFRV